MIFEFGESLIVVDRIDCFYLIVTALFFTFWPIFWILIYLLVLKPTKKARKFKEDEN